VRLAFRNYRVVDASRLDDATRRAIGADAGARVEVVDVDEGQRLRYRGYFFEGGSAAVVDTDGHRVLAAAQHGVEPGADPNLVEAIGAAYAAARPRIVQTIFFDRPRRTDLPVLGEIEFDDETGCWRARPGHLTMWLSGADEPEPAQVKLATSLLVDFAPFARAVDAVAPGAAIRELELWKPGVVLVHLDGAEPGRIELPWP
jgi:hypothetical protein